MKQNYYNYHYVSFCKLNFCFVMFFSLFFLLFSLLKLLNRDSHTFISYSPGYSFFILVFVQIEKNENLMLGVYFPLCLTCWMKRGRNPLSITHIFQALKILVSIKSHATTAWICAEELFQCTMKPIFQISGLGRQIRYRC